MSRAVYGTPRTRTTTGLVVAALIGATLAAATSPSASNEPTTGRALGLAPNHLGPKGTQLGDLTGDGLADVFAYRPSDQAWLVSSAGIGAWRVLAHGALVPSRTWLADLTGDGKDDVFYYRQDDHAWRVSSAGANDFTTYTHGVLDPAYTRFGDLDGDGKADVFTRHADGVWRVSYGGLGDWQIINGGWFDPVNTWIGDLNGDSEDDLLAINADYSWAVSYSGTGPWQTINNGWLNPHNTQLVDVNGDGEDDVFTVTSDGQWRVSHSGTGGWITVNNGYLDPTRTWLADMDGDNAVDVFTVTEAAEWRLSSGATTAWQGINNGRLPFEAEATLSAPFNVLARPCEDRCADPLTVVSTLTPDLSATVLSTVPASIAWEIRRQGASSVGASYTTSAASGGPTTLQVPNGVLADRTQYEFRVVASNAYHSTASPWVKFATGVGEIDPDGHSIDPDDADATSDDSWLSEPQGLTIDLGTPSTKISVSAVGPDASNTAKEETLQRTADGDLDMSFGGLKAEPPIGGSQIPWNEWAACKTYGITDKFKKVKDYDRLWWPGPYQTGVSWVRFYCGRKDTVRVDGKAVESAFGYRHVAERHRGDFGYLAYFMGRQWQDLAGWEMSWLADDPYVVTHYGGPGTGRNARYCVERKFVFMLNDGKIGEHWAVMILGKSARRIMTVFPTQPEYDDGSYCISQGGTTVRDVRWNRL